MIITTYMYNSRFYLSDGIIRIYHSFVQWQGNLSECHRFAVHDKAYWVVDAANFLTQGWISLSLYKVVVDYFSPTASYPQ